MKKETESLVTTHYEKADRVIKARKTVGELSEVTSGKLPEIEESFYVKRLRRIDYAYIYLMKKLSIKEEDRATNAALKLVLGIVFGMLFGAIMPHWDVIHKAIFNL
jgi:hypothetical protein